ncbi:MAG: efflux RND transporter periplasmic adaptor subunit [Clostridiales bacterium]|nr:efflux RND transporter periplasmic adaptor subunit [Clostridiales bacterium]
MLKKIILTITVIALLAMFSACSYFLPSEVKYVAPKLIDSEKVIMPSVKIRKGDLFLMYDLEATYIPEPTALFTGKLEVTGRVSNIYFSLGEEVKEGDLVLELDTNVIKDKILVQEINVKKIRLSYEQNQALFETGKIDRYTLKLSALTLEAAENYLSDLKIELDLHYVYAPADGAIVYLNFDVGDNAFGEAFGVSKVEDGIFEVLIPSNTDFNDAQLALLDIEIGDTTMVIYEGYEYEVELIRDFSSYHLEFGFDTSNNHFHFKSSQLPPGIGFNKKATVRNITEQALGVVVIPINAVYSAESNPYTYVIIGDEVERRVLELGMNDGVFYEVISGLEEGELIRKVN